VSLPYNENNGNSVPQATNSNHAAVSKRAKDCFAVSTLPSPSFWRGKRVFLTGHTGFKGTWTRLWLAEMGAEVHGYALPPDTSPALHELVGMEGLAGETLADIRDASALSAAISAADPDIILHLAAQPLVRASYSDPVGTFDVNVMGTVLLLEAARSLSHLDAILVVTTDKVYANDDSGRAFGEEDRLGGYDPYSASKAAAELVTASYRQSFYATSKARVATARAGNVLGGGDFAADRLVPDVVRAALAGERLAIRNPTATRPWQHVLDCICGYLVFAEALVANTAKVESLNFGPGVNAEPRTVAQVASGMQLALGLPQSWDDFSTADNPHEMKLLGLDPSRAASVLDWRQRLDVDACIDWTAQWYAQWRSGGVPRKLTLAQISAYTALNPSG
jgi:CDP-glucose 4,6-dehydratase